MINSFELAKLSRPFSKYDFARFVLNLAFLTIFIDKSRVANTKFKANLTAQVVSQQIL